MKLSQAQRLESFVVSSSLVDSMDQHRERSHAAATGDARPAVIVGVDGLPGALKAVTWAAIEAERRCVPIELVYAIDPSDDSAETGATGRAVAQANAALAAAAARARNVKNTAATDRKTSDPPMLKLGRCALHMARRFTGTMAATMKGFLP